MTDDMIALRELLEKGSDATLLREMIGFAAQRLMELESEALCGAGHRERSEARINLRNGYRDRDRHTRAGQHRRPTRRAGHDYRQQRGRAVLDRVPALAHPPRSARRPAGHLRCP